MAVEVDAGTKRPPLVYVLHSGNLYGTERMALYTAQGLAQQFDPLILAPPGLAVPQALAQGLQARAYSGIRQLASLIWNVLSRHQRLAFVSTGVVHSAICLALNLFYRRRIVHLHLVHGGASERLSYGRKKWLNLCPLQFVAVSHYVRARLIANGVRPARIRVIENFLPPGHVAQSGRARFQRESPSNITVISRLDPEKRVDLLLDALVQTSDLRQLHFHIYGTGPERESLEKRAAEHQLSISFEGFHSDIQSVLAQSDLLLHLCPVEPFGLAIIEAMAAGVPVLVPDSGGAGTLVEDNVTGFRFRANDAFSLAERLRQLTTPGTVEFSQVAERARRLHQTRFSAAARIQEYRQLLMEGLA